VTDYTLSGQWQAVLSVYDVTEAEYDLELRENGQIAGGGRMTTGGTPGVFTINLADGRRTIPVAGRWSYERPLHRLELNMTTLVRGRELRHIVAFQTTGRELGWLESVTTAGLPCRLRRMR
jgi:hypothetical protein